jgi:dienelactone hydrolase
VKLGDSVRRIVIEESGVRGVAYLPGTRSNGHVVVLPGSGGGIPEGYARKLCSYGLAAMALAYFRAEGLPDALEEIPVETVADGVSLFSTKFADGDRVSIMGSSKGAELALLAASLVPDLFASVVGVAPQSVVWYGLGTAQRSSWTWQGESVPFLESRRLPIETDAGMRCDVGYDFSLYTEEEIEAATIKVERIDRPILLLSGDDDHMCPAALMADRIARRSKELAPAVTVESRVYAGAGHAFLHSEFFSNARDDGRPLFDFGGSPQADAVARDDGWLRISEFLGTR